MRNLDKKLKVAALNNCSKKSIEEEEEEEKKLKFKKKKEEKESCHACLSSLPGASLKSERHRDYLGDTQPWESLSNGAR